jgi:nucleoside-diphosphate-sugar epimerase
MRVFVTGATGFIGSAIVPELIRAGHQVVGLARSDAAAQSLAAMGAQVRRGDLETLDVLRDAAAASDGVVHAGYIHDFSKMAESGAVDRRAIEAMGEGLRGSDRPLIVTSGVALLAPGQVATEASEPPASMPRLSEAAAMALAAGGARATSIRLAPSVHGKGDHGFVPHLIGIAREKGVSAYVGDGLNRWPGVHRLDAARLYRLVLEDGAKAPRYHGIADEGVPTREIAEVIGRRLNLPVVSKSREEAGAHFGWIGHFFAVDCPASSARTQEQLGWRPTQPGLIADLDSEAYFPT